MKKAALVPTEARDLNKPLSPHEVTSGTYRHLAVSVDEALKELG